ncbi:hypothetical protein JZ751_017629 [Albula glossodonta]|uniref:CUB domain-containing protein n=1 Tax=Albula glossodonta TaxID=121402 RepID=A0A8T2PIA9_9TELE|nr:hypothetical protein JZ751_017629 [Albula glossodonta]
MANLENRLQKLSKLFILLHFMTLKVNAIETVLLSDSASVSGIFIGLRIHYMIRHLNLVDFCGQTIRGDGMIVNSHQDSRKYYFVTMGTDCHLTMQAISPKDKVQFHFRFFLVYSLLRVSPLNQPFLSPTPLLPEASRSLSMSGPPNHGLRLEPTPGDGSGDPCHAGSYIQFYDGKDKTSPPIGPPLCGKTLPRPVLSTGNYLTLRLMTRGTQPRVDFVGDFTSFRLDSQTYVSLLALYIALGVLAGWFLWRVSVCRFLPCCNSACASCQLCTRSCSRSRKELRLGKVTPQGTATATTVAM